MKALKVRKKGCALRAKEQFNGVWCRPVTGEGPAVSWGQQSEDSGASSGVPSTDHLMHKGKEMKHFSDN